MRITLMKRISFPISWNMNQNATKRLTVNNRVVKPTEDDRVGKSALKGLNVIVLLIEVKFMLQHLTTSQIFPLPLTK